jgi:anti-sigma regulatory factor (Ser/Thr protein kinase)
MMEDLSLHVLDIAENAVAAGATRITILINENEARDVLTVRVSDNGPGMTKKALRRALDPFFTTKGKRTGLGLPFLAQAAELCRGGVTVESRLGQGVRVTARFRYGHVDRPPLTNMRATIEVLAVGHSGIDFRYRHRRNGQTFMFSSRRCLAGPGASGPPDFAVLRRLRNELRAGLEQIGRT